MERTAWPQAWLFLATYVRPRSALLLALFAGTTETLPVTIRVWVTEGVPHEVLQGPLHLALRGRHLTSLGREEGACPAASAWPARVPRGR